MGDDFKTGAAQHRFRTGAVWHPPIRGIARIAMLNEMHFWEFRQVKRGLVPEVVIFCELPEIRAAPMHRLKHEDIPRDVLANEVKREQRMAKMIEDAEKENDVKLLTQ